MRKTPCVPGMLGTHVQENEIRAVAFTAHAPFLRTEAERLLLGHLLSRAAADTAPFPSREPDALCAADDHPGLRHQDALEMRMAVKDDPEHVPHFALVPVGGRPDVRDASAAKAGLPQGLP